MADVSKYLENILNAVYGEEVRGSIHDAIAAMNEESSQAIKDSSDAKDSAKAFAAEAGKSAAEAKGAETNAKNSATAAKASETKADGSATAAKASETNAGNSATAARQSAENASGSASTAQHAAESAGNSAAEAKGAETNAEKSAGNAKDSEISAGNSASAAKASETDAGKSAASAKSSETNAGDSANAARNYAASAAESEDAAHGYALLASSFQLNITYTAEELEKYIHLLSTIEQTLSGFEYSEYLLDFSGSQILDSTNTPIGANTVGFEAMMATLLSVQRLVLENSARINECFEAIAKLRESFSVIPATSHISDSSGEDILDTSGEAVIGTCVYLTR